MASRVDAILLACTLTSGCARVAIRAEVEIAAPPQVVWCVLADLRCYHRWNAFTTRVDGELALGNELVLHVQVTPGRAERLQHQRVLALAPAQQIVWETKLGHLLRAVRTQTLTPLADGGARYSTTDAFDGALTSLVMRLYRRDLERGFAEVTNALKQRAESAMRFAMTSAPLGGRDAEGVAKLAAEMLRCREP